MRMEETWKSRGGNGSELGSVPPPALAWVKKAELRAVAPLAGVVQPLATRDSWGCYLQLGRCHRLVNTCSDLRIVLS